VAPAAQPASPQPTILGLGPTLFYVIVGLIIAIIILAVASVFRRSRKQKTASKNLLRQ
jgi:subtilase family serine protease